MLTEAEILLKVIGAREARAQLEGTAAAVGGLSAETDAAAVSMGVATRRGFLMNQMLYTLRRFAYFGTIALGSMAAGSLVLGFNFDSAMQQATVALQPVQADIGSVHDLLRRLFNFTKYTPFQFKDITIAFRQMYLGMRTVGISSETVMTTLHSMVDALSAVGKTSPMNLNRVAVALQHMAFQGRLTGYTVNQLARDGIPIFAALHAELGLTGDQLHRISTLGIPVQTVLEAINKYIETTPGLMNAAHRQATMTLHGLFTTFKDNLSQVLGEAEKNWFHGFQGMLNRANDWFGRLESNLHRTHSLIKALDLTITPESHNIAFAWKLISSMIHNAWIIFKTFFSTVVHNKAVLYTLLTGLLVLAGVLSALAHTTAVWVPLLKILIPLYILLWVRTKALATATKLWGLYEVLLTSYTLDWKHNAISAWRDAKYFWSLFVRGYVAESDKVIIHTALMDRAVLGLRDAFKGLTLAGLGWAGLAILIGYMLVNLYLNWKPFHDLVNDTAKWLWKCYFVLSYIAFLLGGPLLAADIIIIRNWTRLRDITMSLVNWVKRLVHWLLRAAHLAGAIHLPHIPGLGRVEHVFHLVGLQGGGNVTAGGAFLVGERGPEVVSLPAGSAVSPVTATNFPVTNFFNKNDHGETIVEVYLDSKLLYKRAAKRQNDKRARL